MPSLRQAAGSTAPAANAACLYGTRQPSILDARQHVVHRQGLVEGLHQHSAGTPKLVVDGVNSSRHRRHHHLTPRDAAWHATHGPAMSAHRPRRCQQRHRQHQRGPGSTALRTNATPLPTRCAHGVGAPAGGNNRRRHDAGVPPPACCATTRPLPSPRRQAPARSRRCCSPLPAANAVPRPATSPQRRQCCAGTARTPAGPWRSLQSCRQPTASVRPAAWRDMANSSHGFGPIGSWRSRCAVASWSLCPPTRRARQDRRHRRLQASGVDSPTSSTLACSSQFLPDTTIDALRMVPSASRCCCTAHRTAGATPLRSLRAGADVVVAVHQLRLDHRRRPCSWHSAA